MSSPSVFISYSHADEWLKDELITHFSALKRSGAVSLWHDRMIPAGGIIKDEIDEKVKTSDIFLFLVSPNFLSSDYCFEKEFLVAVSRRDKGEAEIIPVIIRDCDWNADRLKTFNALPPDGIAVTRNAGLKTESHHRDAAWLRVIEGLKEVIAVQKKRLEPPSALSHSAVSA